MPSGVYVRSEESRNRLKSMGYKKGCSPWIKGKKFSDESKQKMSLSHLRGLIGKTSPLKGIKTGPNPEHSKRMMGSTPWNKGKKYPQIAGEKSHLWRGGISSLVRKITNLFEYRQWRSDVFHRDNFTCVKCGDGRGGNLQADHIKPKSLIIRQYQIKSVEQALACAELWDINNGRTLCEPCHIKTDTFGNGMTKKILIFEALE